MKESYRYKNAPAAIGRIAKAVQVGNMLFASGQLGIDPATGLFVEGSVKRNKPPKRSRMFTLSWQRQVIASMMS